MLDTMNDYPHQIQQLLAEAHPLAEGPTKVALIERAVQLADAHQDLQAGYQTRVRLMGAALSGGQPDLLLVAFSWCLAQSERDPQQFPEVEILWQFRWVISELVEFPNISKAQIDELFADMERRYRRAGSTLRAFHTLRRMVALDMGDRAAADAAHDALTKSLRDWLSDGPDAETSFLVDYLVFTGQDTAAVERAWLFLAGRQTSSHHLGFLHAKLLLPLLKLGRGDAAARSHLAGYRLVMRNARYVPRFAEHLMFLALTGNFPRAFRLLERHLSEAVGTVSDFSRMQFYHAGRLLLEQVAATGRTGLRLRLPPEIGCYAEAGRYEPNALAAWFAGQSLASAGRFDARNGNDYYTRLFTDLAELRKLAVPVPLPLRSEDSPT
ncbi:MAG: hypothetical protein ACJ8F7_12330 [Gemmataceae bacterium]